MAERGRVSSYKVKGHTYWRIRIRIGGELHAFYQHKGVPFASEAHAQKVLEQIRGCLGEDDSPEAIAGFFSKRSKPNLVTEVLGKYLDDLEERHALGEISAYTVTNLRRRIPGNPPTPAQHFAFWIRASIHEVKPRSLERFKRALERAGVAPSSIRLTLDQFRAFLAWCVAEELLGSVPAFPSVRVTRKRPRLLTPSQQAAVLAAIPWNERGIFLAMAIGMRPASARAALVQDAQSGFLHVCRSRQAQDARAPVGPTKGRKESWLPMTRELERWVREHAAERLPGALLFWNPKGRTAGQGWSHAALRGEWERASAAAGVPFVPLYQATKHSFATGRLVAGKSKDAVAEFLQISRAQVDTYAQWARELSAEVLDEEQLSEGARAAVVDLRGGERVVNAVSGSGNRPKMLEKGRDDD